MPRLYIFALTLLLATNLANAGEKINADEKALAAGDAVPSLTAKDQFDKPLTVDAQTQLLLFSNSMSASKLVTEAMAATDSTCQQSEAIRYFAEISKMPSLIAKTFALPKMRERPFRIGLIWESEKAASIPRRDDQVTMISTKNNIVIGVDFARDTAIIAQAISRACPTQESPQ